MTRPQAHDAATRERALRLLEQGRRAADVARELNVPAATVRSWAHRCGQVQPSAGVGPQDWAERKRAGAEDWWQTATDAVRKVRELIKAGDERRAKDLALTAAIAVDKAGVLETAAERAQERQAAITERQAQQLAAVIRVVLEDLGVPIRGAIAGVLRYHLERVGDGGTPSTSPDAAAAKRELGAALGVLPELESAPREPLALPAPRPPHPTESNTSETRRTT